MGTKKHDGLRFVLFSLDVPTDRLPTMATFLCFREGIEILSELLGGWMKR